MDPFAFKLTYEFSLCPTKIKLNQLHNFLKNYSLDKLDSIKYLFFTAYLTEIRKTSDLSIDCIVELLHLLKSINSYDDGKILSIVLEEICTFIQVYLTEKQGKKKPDDFGCLNIGLSLDILRMFHTIFHHINNHKVEEVVYSQRCLLLLGYVVSFLLFHCEYFKERQVQNEALDSLDALFTAKPKRIVNRADIIVTFAPGIFQSLTRIVKADRKTGSQVKSRAVRCLAKLIVLIYGEQSSVGTNVVNDIRKVSDSVSELKDIMVVRDERWRNSTWDNIVKIIQITKFSILECSEEEHWRVKLELVRMSISILENCSCAGTCAAHLIECLIALKSDLDQVVREEADKSIAKVASMVFRVPIYWDVEKRTSLPVIHSGKLLLSIVVQENVDRLVESMKDLRNIVSDQVKCNILQVLDGFLSIYVDEKLSPLSFVQMKRIIYHLIDICKLDYSLLDLSEPPTAEIEEATLPFQFCTGNNCEFFPKRFLHFNNERVYSIVQSIISRISISGLSNSLTSMLQSLAEEKPDDMATIVLLTKLIIRSVTNSNTIERSSQISLVKSILSTYFDFEIMNMETTIKLNSNVAGDFWTDSVAALTYNGQVQPKEELITVTSSATQKPTPAILKQNSLVLAVIMELCAACCLCLKQCFLGDDDDEVDSWLMRTCLFEVMNKSQQSPHILSLASAQCFYALSTVHKRYDCSLSTLVRINADYIMDSIARRLRSTALMFKSRRLNDTVAVARTESACRCLVTLCCNADNEIIPFLEIIVQQMFYCIDETHGFVVNELFMQVLKQITLAVCRWRKTILTPVLSIKDSDLVVNESLSNVLIVRQYLIDRNDLLVSSGFRKNLTDETLSENPLDQKEESYFTDKEEEALESIKPELSKEVVLIQNIAYRCINLMSHSNPRIRLSCLDILNDAIVVLQKEEVLNILIHKVWEPLEHRLWDREFPVIIKAFDLVNTISQLSGSFLYTKVRTNFVYKLSTLLERCARINLSQLSSMRYSGIYRLQKNLITFLSNLCVRTGIHSLELEEAVDSFLLFLSDQQPQELREICEMSLKSLFKIDPCMIWFKLSQIVTLNDRKLESGANQIFGHVYHSYDSHYLSNTQNLLRQFNRTIK